MKKTISLLCLLFGLFVCVTAFSACGGDDESSSGVPPQSSKHIAKVITEDGSSFYESSYTYDSQGRVTKIIGTESGTSTNSYSEIEYQYGEMLIVSKMKEEGTSSNGQSYTFSETHSYTLENGRIVKDEEKQGWSSLSLYSTSSSRTEIYSYDANNYLSSISATGSYIPSETEIIKWSNGNLIKLGEGSYDYSSCPWAKGFPFYLKGSNTDGILFSMGYYGNIPKNLPSKYTDSENSGYTYEYSFEGGYVTKVVTTPFVGTKKSQKSIKTIIWE